MRIQKSQAKQTQRSPALNYTVLVGLLIGLFVIGLRLGNVALASQNPASVAADAKDKPSGGAFVNPPFQVGDFKLTNQSGASMTLKDLRGRAVLLFFGYTHCPDVCPTTLADFTLIKKALGLDADKAIFVFVTVDNERDTPDVLKNYLSRFDSSFVGLTADESTLRRMAAEYGAYFNALTDKQQHDKHSRDHMEGISSENFFIQHTSPSYLIDPKGFLRVVYFNGTSTEVLVQGIRQILQGAS